MTATENDERISKLAELWKALQGIGSASLVVHATTEDVEGLIDAAERAGYTVDVHSDNETKFRQGNLAANGIGPQCTIYGQLVRL